MLLEPVVRADETEVQVLKEPGREAKTTPRMWVYCTGNRSKTPMVLYEYRPTRSGEHAKRWLSGFRGYLVTDGYAGYNSVPDVTRCYCWAHVRRHWVDAIPKTENKTGSSAVVGVEYCNRLFALEDKLEEKKLSAEEWTKARQYEAKPLLDEYWPWLSTVGALGGSALGKAVKYSLDLREGLSTFVEDSRISLSNNLCENHIRPFVVGRKNWLFSDTSKGAEASALCYSVLETAKANGLNVYLYLLYLLTEMPKAGALNDDVLERCLPWSPSLPEWCRQQ
jgi:transposase